jgi:cytochrome d ubiquinol oxidase subunit I
MWDTLLISRLQFAFTISFHILFPAFSIGLATFLTIMEGRWLKTKQIKYLAICKFWTKVFALTFGMGVVSGIVMEFQLGTNWAPMTQTIGGVLGALFTYEVLTAFFIEAGFLGVMIFGWNKVGPKLHYCATLLVTFGVTLSAFWILSANSWMHTPSGVSFIQHHFLVTSWREVIFNPSVLSRFLHMLFASYVSTLFIIASVSAYYLLHKRHDQVSKTCLSFALWALLAIMPLQIGIGDEVGLIMHEHQPIKTAAIEGLWNTTKGAPLLLFAWPNMQAQTNQWAIGIPRVASLINTHTWNGSLQGLKSVPASDQPYVPLVFFSFRIMVALGFLMLAINIFGLVLRLQKKLYSTAWFLRVCQYAAPLGFIAMWTGWITSETGRQPWIVYGYLKTSDGISKISTINVWISFILIFIVYGVIFGVFYFRYLSKILLKGPNDNEIPNLLPFSYLPMASMRSKGES